LNVAKLSDDDRIKFVFVGGADKDVENYRKNNQLSNVLFLGQKKKEHIPKILKCADILLLPNIPVSEESFKYTSPIKMFEYMASKKPVIASDLPSIREVLNKENSVLVESGNPEEIISSINKLLGNQDLYNKIAKQAFSDVAQYTWENRAKKILKMINSLKIK